jgi:hypothetical protein
MIKELCVKCWNTLESHALHGCDVKKEETK